MSRRPSRASRLACAAVSGYLLGMTPSADLAARMATGGSVDLRAAGSGNPGGVNAMRVLGRRVGIGVVAADISKGMLAAFLGRPGPRPTGALPRASLATTAVIASRALLSLRRREPVAPTPNRAVS